MCASQLPSVQNDSSDFGTRETDFETAKLAGAFLGIGSSRVILDS
jgi:hypothetical protein